MPYLIQVRMRAKCAGEIEGVDAGSRGSRLTDALGSSTPVGGGDVTRSTRGLRPFKSLTERIDTASATGKLVFHIFGTLAEFERNLITERTLSTHTCLSLQLAFELVE